MTTNAELIAETRLQVDEEGRIGPAVAHRICDALEQADQEIERLKEENAHLRWEATDNAKACGVRMEERIAAEARCARMEEVVEAARVVLNDASPLATREAFAIDPLIYQSLFASIEALDKKEVGDG